MAKKQTKRTKEETLETILFNCRNSLRGRAAMTDKRDLLQTLVFFQTDEIKKRWDANEAELVNALNILGYGKE